MIMGELDEAGVGVKVMGGGVIEGTGVGVEVMGGGVIEGTGVGQGRQTLPIVGLLGKGTQHESGLLQLPKIPSHIGGGGLQPIVI